MQKNQKCSAYVTCHADISLQYGLENKIVGYKVDDVDTILNISYEPNGLFDTPIDTFVWTNTELDYYRYSDTGLVHYLPLAFSGGYTSSRLNDDAVLLKSIGRVYHLTEIMAGGSGAQTVSYWCDESPSCGRSVLSMKVDGVYTDVSNPAVPFALYK